MISTVVSYIPEGSMSDPIGMYNAYLRPTVCVPCVRVNEERIHGAGHRE